MSDSNPEDNHRLESWDSETADILTSVMDSDPEDSLGDVETFMDSADDERVALLDESDGFVDSVTNSSSRDRRLKNVTPYEDALLLCGFGKFHILILFLCGWAVSSDAIEVLSVSFLLPSATCDLKLSSQDKGLLNSMVFIGMMIGGYFWGTLADKWGRRNILIWSLLVNGVGNLASSVSQTFYLFILCRLISGIGVGGSMPVIFTYYTEFQHKARRGAMISLLATFWMAGNIVAAGLAWIIIPRKYLSLSDGSFTYHSWRVFVAFCTIPSLTSAIMFIKMPESPKYLLQVGREQDAIHVLKKVHTVNQSHQAWQVEHLSLSSDEEDSSSESSFHLLRQRRASCCQRVKVTLSKLLESTLVLFRKPLRRVTIVLLIINFTLAFGYYGLFLWFPELFERIDKYGGSFCDVRTGNGTGNSTYCEDPSNSIYVEGFLTSISNLPGNIVSILIVERIGRKTLLASSMTLSGVSVFLLWFVKTKWQNILMSCLFGAISVCGFNMLDVLQTELFPTDARSTAFGVQTASARVGAILGNIIFGELVDLYCAIPMLLVASLLTFGGMISLILPNTAGQDIH